MNVSGSPHKSLKTQHGMSFLIEYDNTRILFDTGYNEDFLENAERMKESSIQTSQMTMRNGSRTTRKKTETYNPKAVDKQLSGMTERVG